ncbi:relaxin receptor 2 [Daktulosphaira vitifoliae]|uniref:relaxin receptor 2 n=1 Tax=Daktulosphaira vitifoliae TaxID=58002 RepID=UPI0021AA9B19|nr:relaxin receptor 2 [Daktulosphaira vitifoliae]
MQATRSAIISIFIILCLFFLALITLYLNFGTKVCHEGTFLCSKSEICIPNLYKCNKYKDCLHGEDEDPVQCADLHGLSLYNDFIITNRTTLKSIQSNITYVNNINLNKTLNNETEEKLNATIVALHNNFTYFYKSTAKPCALKNYPPVCQCSGPNGTYLRCNNVGLKKVPEYVSGNVERMTFVNNSILLTNYSFDVYPNLKVISLEYNVLSRIPPFVFSHQSKLIRLLLLYNELKVLEKHAFFGIKNIDINTANNKIYISRDLSFNKLSLTNVCFPHWPLLRVLNLHNNCIEKVDKCLFTQLPSLADLDLSYNKISFIDENAFINLVKLVDLNLTENHLLTLTPLMFQSLTDIHKLSLANNPVKYLHADLFKSMKSLKSLSLDGIELENINTTVFDKLKNLEILYLKEFHYCALYARNVPLCYPNTDDLSSSYNLLSKPILRSTLWTVTFFTFIMNAMVLYGRMFGSLRDENHAISFVIRNLAVADMLMALYLTVIGYQDSKYRDEFYAYAQEWKSSNLCTVIGLIAVVSSEVSLLILVFLSLERFLLIAVPFSGYHVLKLKTATYCMAAIWLVAICISTAPLLLLKHATKFYGSNGMCYPLYIEDPFLSGWQYSAFIFLGLHSTSLLLLSALYMLMFISVWKTRQAARISVGDFEFAVRFFFIVLANSFCWLPIIVLKFAAMQKFHISSELYGWVVVFIVPINALVNPLLYTFTTPKYRNVLTSKNVFKRPNRDSSSGLEMSQTSHQTSVSAKVLKKSTKKPILENSIDITNEYKKNSQKNNLEILNGQH